MVLSHVIFWQVFSRGAARILLELLVLYNDNQLLVDRDEVKRDN